MTFKNSQWAVTKYGLEVLKPEPPYKIEASRLTETRPFEPQFYDWPLHMAEKEWVNIDAFNEAFSKALEFHKGRYSPKADSKMLEPSFKEARRIAKERY